MKAHGVPGMVIDGGCRDIDHMMNLGFAAWWRHVCATGGRPRVKKDAVLVPIEVAGIYVDTGDIVVADATSVAFVPAAVASRVLEECLRLEHSKANSWPIWTGMARSRSHRKSSASCRMCAFAAALAGYAFRTAGCKAMAAITKASAALRMKTASRSNLSARIPDTVGPESEPMP